MNIRQLIGAVVGGIGGDVRTGNPHADHYVSYLATMVEQALTRWESVGKAGVRCRIMTRGGSHDELCGAPAISGCMACGTTVCLNHAFLSPQGVLCFACADELIAAKNPSARRERDRGRPFGFVDPEEGETDAEKRRRYLGVLGLGEKADDDQIRVAFRHLAKKYHPDRAPEGRKAAAERKFKEIQAAYDWLLRERSRAA
jgi:hypothetical protein